jgi:FAD binding domain/D-arabinono-1,4-lactone oxidase
VDEDNALVTVNAGVPQRMLLNYLSEYRYWKQSAGWTLPAFSWFIDQTIGGAVATGTHGSSMRYGSLSSQVKSMRVIIANGTLLNISPEDDVHLWRAFGVSVGRLGVITELTMRIKPQQAVRRSLQELDYEEFAAQIKKVQEEYKTARASGDQDAQKRALAQIDETQALWHPALREVWRVDFSHLDKEPLSVLLNLDHSDPLVQAMNGPSSGVYAQANRQAVPPNNRITTNARFWANFYATSTRGFVTPGTFESRKAFLSFSDFGTRTTSVFAPYNQLEVAVPMEVAGDCLMEVGNEMYGPDSLWEGFRTPPLIRFITGEDFYISPTNGGARMYVNMEDYLSKSTGKPNEKWDRVVEIFLTRCNARLHWAKYGQPQLDKCFDGAQRYPQSWCDFGCAVNQLDPTGKFASESSVWKWKATRNGQAAEFASCCTPQGFNKQECQCASSPAC